MTWGWLLGALADAGHRSLTGLVLGSDQDPILRQAASIAVLANAAQLRPDSAARLAS
jgi:hypothetical protein